MKATDQFPKPEQEWQKTALASAAAGFPVVLEPHDQDGTLVANLFSRMLAILKEVQGKPSDRIVAATKQLLLASKSSPPPPKSAPTAVSTDPPGTF